MIKKLLVLGGSFLQSGLIETAVSKGYDVHVLDRDIFCYANKINGILFKNIDLSNLNSVDQYYSKHSFDAVIGPVTELGNITAANLSEKYGFLYNDLSAVKATTDKSIMRTALNCTNLDTPKFKQFISIDDVLANFDFPLIVKPPISSASRGVTLVNRKEDFNNAINEAHKFCDHLSDILIEEYIVGEQFSIETITSRGNHYIVGITKEIMSGPPYFVERTDIISIDLYKNYISKFQEYINILLDSLGITVGPCHIEVKVNTNGIFLIEIASRSGLLRDRLITASKSSNYNELILKSYLDQEIKESDIKAPSINALLGVMMHPSDLNIYLQAKKDEVLYSDYFFGKGPEIQPKRLTDAYGYFFVQSSGNIFDYVL
ncbi:MAG: ATP-grasp domain-containing protein [Bacteroidales bacterium]|nr:ATP-grasp domain-containing protein [Bacteroidales bacterium]